MSYCNAQTLPQFAGQWQMPGAKPQRTQQRVEPRYNLITTFEPSGTPKLIVWHWGENRMTTVGYLPIPHPWNDIIKTDSDNPFKAQVHITKRIDQQFRNGEFSAVDRSLSMFPVEESSADLLVSILSSTVPGRKKLKNRKTFFDRVEHAITKRGDFDPTLLAGLK